MDIDRSCSQLQAVVKTNRPINDTSIMQSIHNNKPDKLLEHWCKTRHYLTALMPEHRTRFRSLPSEGLKTAAVKIEKRGVLLKYSSPSTDTKVIKEVKLASFKQG